MPDSDRVGPKVLISALENRPLTARRASAIIACFTIVITLAGGTLAWLTNRDDFASLGAGLWWALQTVSTVGYGDVVPTTTSGRVIGAAVILSGIGFLTVITGSVTAVLIETARKRAGGKSQAEISAQLEEISERLSAIEAGLAPSREAGDDPP